MIGLEPGRPVLAVSPHLDDAVMAVGATLAALADAGHEVIVCTIFAGEPQPPTSSVATAFHADCGLDQRVVHHRRQEDLHAQEIIGARAVHLDHLDAIYRTHGSEWLCEGPRAMFDVSLPDEPDLRAAISKDVTLLIRELRPAAVWTCAAIGDHVDHRLTRAAVLAAARREAMTPSLWEGLPYAIGLPAPAGVRPKGYGLDDAHLRRKLRAIEQYPSQLRMLWPNGEDWRRQFLDHARNRGEFGAAELVWNAADSGSPMRSRATQSGGQS